MPNLATWILQVYSHQRQGLEANAVFQPQTSCFSDEIESRIRAYECLVTTDDTTLRFARVRGNSCTTGWHLARGRQTPGA